MYTREDLFQQAIKFIQTSKLNKQLIAEIGESCSYYLEYYRRCSVNDNKIQQFIIDLVYSLIDMCESIESLIATNPYSYLDFMKCTNFLFEFDDNSNLANKLLSVLKELENSLSYDETEIMNVQLLKIKHITQKSDEHTYHNNLIKDVLQDFEIEKKKLFLLHKKNINELFDLFFIFDKEKLGEDLMEQLLFYSILSGEKSDLIKLILFQKINIEIPNAYSYDLNSLTLSEAIGLYLIEYRKDVLLDE